MIPRFGDARDWFFEKRFGLFVHWGLYAVPAWHEQVQFRQGLPRGEYEKLIHEFNPVRFDPDAWLDLAEETGMRYVTLTSKHVDGFCLWDTAQHDYNVMNTPYGRDVVGLLAEACHRRGFPLCLYYSIADMHHPNYPNAGRSYELPEPDPGDEPDFDKYIACVKAQIRELCTDYGEISGIWWDANVVRWGHPTFNDEIRALQPGAVINGRGPDDGDFETPERDYRPEGQEIRAFERTTEACQSVGQQSWGYRVDEDYYTEKYLMQSIDRMMAKGANYLLNVGPKPDGTIADEDVRILRAIGRWRRAVREAFDGVEPASHMTENKDVLLTRRDNTLYVHLFRDPSGTSVVLSPIDKLPRRATLLNTGQELETRVEHLPRFFRAERDPLCIRNLPVTECRDTVMVLKLEFDDLGE